MTQRRSETERMCSRSGLETTNNILMIEMYVFLQLIFPRKPVETRKTENVFYLLNGKGRNLIYGTNMNYDSVRQSVCYVFHR